ncbi:OsmC family peroxiredoxin [Flavobacterium piscinae]|uniref:OsmC family peroxiredoxin n=1 Tax=Flavobacterium piscinae TaxID=2506424 RepID=A0A4Q1KZA8_9FLAO|nr:OsmC family protein [Flavobacterium piscinae]RXR34899.1 OsmC family peroxiredoxin [Flavobacterium piscinae]
MTGQHHYKVTIKWTGNNGQGTKDYRSYERSHTVLIEGKQDIFCSSDPSFRGDKTKQNPEELFLASISSCHMLWYLHLCAVKGIVVIDYSDNAIGTMQETQNGGGNFTEVTLHPVVTISDKTMIETANELHKKANELCFIANSCNFPIHHNSTCITQNA